MPFRWCNAPCHFSEVNAELPRRIKPDILLNLFGWCNSLLKDGEGAFEMFVHCVWLLSGPQPEAKT